MLVLELRRVMAYSPHADSGLVMDWAGQRACASVLEPTGGTSEFDAWAALNTRGEGDPRHNAVRAVLEA
jgi:hypothetical protein